MRCRSLTLAILPALVWAADPVPEFTAAGVVRGDLTVQILVPGADGMSIYGHHLGPPSGCAGAGAYPSELCGTQVLIGDKPAELVHVSASQINFKVPKDSPDIGTVDLRVVYKGQSSFPLTMTWRFRRSSRSPIRMT